MQCKTGSCSWIYFSLFTYSQCYVYVLRQPSSGKYGRLCLVNDLLSAWQ